jgi:hypothetical protein
MTKEQVERLLGHPQQRFTEEEFRRGRTYIGGGDSLLQNEYWLYRGVPREGETAMITFREGKVLGVTHRPDRE